MRNDDDDDDDVPLGAWVLVTYKVMHSVELLFLGAVDGKPRADLGPTWCRTMAYRWNSYHAARKFQRSHPALRGYVILNLSAIEEQAERQREVKEERLAALKAAAPIPTTAGSIHPAANPRARRPPAGR